MANSLSAEKRNRQNTTRRLRNRADKSTVRTSVKAFESAVKAGDKTQAETAFRAFVKLMDTAQRKGIYHVNTAARKKSRLHKQLNAMA
ncbi:30S ribosomal protein S20 [Spirochaeta cellobiosiphila]|uniref:30S ribosomal protein S20 n=1 Tax=Spirochaeta cellobiosiphila TaxID=504483 RepID=UPI00048BDD7A|nr:30S ribosomal protein S20 [Spirochaeta cellobiosiphila]